MARQKKLTYAIITPKTEAGKKRMGHYGDKWVVRSDLNASWQNANSTQKLVLMSRDGDRCLILLNHNDPDFDVRIEQ